jgi:tRNA pseudouridine38-40 synthase
MARYFIEVAYEGSRYSGFQVQENSNTIQAEVEKAFQTFQRSHIQLTGSSRTDAGVHAIQNFFHFDFEEPIHRHAMYKLNAILPKDIAVNNIFQMPSQAHARFDATSRTYIYHVHRSKDPFLTNRSLYYPYRLNYDLLQEGAAYLKTQLNFFAFSKTNTQVGTFNCAILKSEWELKENTLLYTIKGNRFLRGMVRLITATLLKLGAEKISLKDFRILFESKSKCGFSVPSHGLYLKGVSYPENYFGPPVLRFT